MTEEHVVTINEAFDIATKHEQEDRAEQAIAVYEAVLKGQPQSITALFRRGKLYYKTKDYKSGINDFTQLLGLSEEKHIVHVHIGDCCMKLIQYDLAVDNYKKAIAHKPDYMWPYIPLFNLLNQMGKFDEAAAIVKKAFEDYPESSDILFLQGRIYSKNKQFEKAEKSYKKVMDLGVTEHIKHLFFSEFATVKDKLGKYDEAMKLYAQAQECSSKVNSRIAYDPGLDHTEIIDKSLSWITSKNIKDWNKLEFSGKQAPIFLVGFPRSGTTLLEQMLHAHSNLTVTDELQVLPAKIVFLEEIINRQVSYPEEYNSLTESEINAWREEYFAAMGRLRPNIDPNLRIVDKNPISFVYLGIINRFFPDSPAIMMLRDPRDVCLSCFFQTFTPNNVTVHFYNLEEVARLYADTMKLYLHFRKTLSVNILEVKYEDLCNDFENIARKTIEFIGEDWQEDVLNYHEQSRHRFIKTPSHEAVTQPINSAAIGKWKNYEKYLEPVLPILEPYIKEFGY